MQTKHKGQADQATFNRKTKHKGQSDKATINMKSKDKSQPAMTKPEEKTGRPASNRHDRFARPADTRQTLRRLAFYVGKNSWRLVIGLLLSALGAFGGVAANAFLQPIINTFVYEHNFSAAIPSITAMAIIFLASATANYFGTRLMARVAQYTTNLIRRDLFSQLQEMPLAFFDSHSHGELMSTFTNDIDNISQALDQTLVNLLTSAITFLTTLVMMLILSPSLTLLVLLMVGLMLFSIRFIMLRSRTAFRTQQAELADLNGFIEEMTQGQKVVKVFNYEDRAIADFDGKNEKLRQASTQAQTYSVSIFPIMGNLSFVQYAITAMVGAMRIISGRMDIGTLATFLQYTRSFSRPLTQMSNQINVLIAALAGAERVFSLMDQPAEVDEGTVHLLRLVASKDEETDFAAATPDRGMKGYVPKIYLPGVEAGLRNLVWCVHEPDGSYRYVPVCGDIRFDDVTFSYIEGEPVLKNVSLYAKPGQRIAFVGSTGAGKTTVINLINRFYDVQEGAIYFDGIDVKQIKKDDLRLTLGMVLQEVHLFTDTVAGNIRYGDLEATEAEVVAAAKFANADFFIRHLPEGYDTMLHDNGSNLSQGQRQLISIARAAVADPLILILDEATSSVDTRTERLIEKGMDNMMEGRTTFAIAHRLSTVRHSNAIMVLEGGEIMERGDHDQLMELRGRYYDLNMGTVELE